VTQARQFVFDDDGKNKYEIDAINVGLGVPARRNTTITLFRSKTSLELDMAKSSGSAYTALGDDGGPAK